jgi:hypothetical protein
MDTIHGLEFDIEVHGRLSAHDHQSLESAVCQALFAVDPETLREIYARRTGPDGTGVADDGCPEIDAIIEAACGEMARNLGAFVHAAPAS